MERLSKRDIKADQVFEKTLKEHVVKKKRRTLCISIRGGQAVLSGDDESVIFAQDNMENMTIEELMEAMKNMENAHWPGERLEHMKMNNAMDLKITNDLNGGMVG